MILPLSCILSKWSESRPARLMRRLSRAVGGAINVEFGFVAPVLVLLVMGAIDFGRLGMRYAELESVAHAGVDYAVQNQANAADLSSVEQAALADAGSSNVTVSANAYCQCAGGSPQACNVACSDGDYAPMYVTVTAQDALKLLFPYPGLSQTQEISASSDARVR